MDKSRKRLFSNTVYLYIMQLATQILNLVTIPYLTRVLGPTVYGKIGLAVGYMTYVTLILDFGFLLSATQEVSEHKEDKAYISGIFTSVLIVKLVLAFIIAAVFVIFGKTGVINEKDIPFYISDRVCCECTFARFLLPRSRRHEDHLGPNCRY